MFRFFYTKKCFLGKKLMEIMSIKGGPTLNGKFHFKFPFVFRITSLILTVLPVILLSTIFILNIKDLETNKSKQISFLPDPDPMSND